jgi:hypothetical protein
MLPQAHDAMLVAAQWAVIPAVVGLRPPPPEARQSPFLQLHTRGPLKGFTRVDGARDVTVGGLHHETLLRGVMASLTRVGIRDRL